MGIKKNINKTVLCIVDGFGSSTRKDGNAVLAADMKNFNTAFDEYPSCYIKASGKEVGLDSDKDAGNSEVGHNAIGSGQIIKQGLSLLNEKYKKPNLTGNDTPATNDTPEIFKQALKATNDTPEIFMPALVGNDTPAIDAPPEIFQTEVWGKLSTAAKKQKLDIIVLLSDGRVHSDIAHLFAVLEECKAENITVSIFAIADGRDVPPQSIKKYIQQTTDFIKKIGVSAKIAVVGGRGQIFMDRYDTQTELLSRAISVCVDGKTAGNVHIGETAQNVDGETTTTAGRQKNPNDKTENAPTTDNVHIGETTQNRAYTNETTQNAPTTGDINKQIDEFYAANPTATDEQLPPFIVNSDGLIKNGDAVLFLNYRGDRAIETARMFDSGQYISPAQYEKIKDCFFVGVLQYDAENNLPKNYLCPPPDIKNTLTEWLCAKGIKQYTVTETVKFGHLTYFFNGNRTEPFDRDLENWCEIESDKLNNQYDKAPKMKAGEIADKLIFNLRHGDFDFYKCNFPNPDMVGHTGVFSAAVTACQFIDKQLGRLIEVCKNDRINLIITADHGNAEEMTDEKGNIKTSHTNNPVPFIVCPFGFCEDYDDILGKRRLKTVAAQNNANGDNAKLLDNGVKDDHAKFVGNGGKDDHAKLVGNGVKYPNIKLKDGEFGLTNIAATVCDLLGIVPNKVWNESIIKNAAQSYEKAKD